MRGSGGRYAFWCTWLISGYLILTITEGVLYRIQAISCPPETFLTGVARSFGLTIVAGICFSWAIAWMLCEWKFSSLSIFPSVRGYTRISPRILIPSVLAVVAIPDLAVSIHAGTCFGTYGIRTQDYLYSKGRLLPWTDVKQITIGCPPRALPSRKHGILYEGPWMNLTTTDGSTFPLSLPPPPAQVWLNIAGLLQHVRPIYDGAATSECSPEDQGFLNRTFR